jgi:hypothetical protein
MSPSDIVGPSPVTSNGTETTEIEDDATEEVRRASTLDEGPERRRSGALLLTTALPDNVRQSSGEDAVSVIHAPESFASWVSDSRASTCQNSLLTDYRSLGILRPTKTSPRVTTRFHKPMMQV